MTIQELASEAKKYMKQKKMGDKEIWVMTDNAPKWFKDMVRKAHDNGEMLPNDWSYEYVRDALNIVEDAEDPEDLPEIEPDIYNADLLAWLGSNLYRAGYVDEATSEFGHSENGVMGDIALGQIKEREQVYYTVLEALREQAE